MDPTTPTRTRGAPTGRAACPNCGDLVPQFHHCSDGRAAKVLSCGDCGRFSYTTDGAKLPMVVPKA